MTGETITAAGLRSWRTQTGMTQVDAAVRLDVPLRTYVGWERGDPIRHGRLLSLALAAIQRGIEPWQAPPDLVDPTPRRGRPRKDAV